MRGEGGIKKPPHFVGVSPNEPLQTHPSLPLAMSEYDSTKRPSTPNSVMTSYDYEYVQNELMRIQDLERSEMVQKLVDKKTLAVKQQLEEARQELEEETKQAFYYKNLFEELMEETQVQHKLYNYVIFLL